MEQSFNWIEGFLTARIAKGFRQVRKGIFQLKHLSVLRAFIANIAVKPNNYTVPNGTPSIPGLSFL